MLCNDLGCGGKRHCCAFNLFVTSWSLVLRHFSVSVSNQLLELHSCPQAF